MALKKITIRRQHMLNLQFSEKQEAVFLASYKDPNMQKYLPYEQNNVFSL
jgi:hypothetical protein